MAAAAAAASASAVLDSSSVAPEKALFTRVVYVQRILDFLDLRFDFDALLNLRRVSKTFEETLIFYSDDLWRRTLRPVSIALPRLLQCCRQGTMLWLVDVVLRAKVLDMNTFTFQMEPVVRGRQSLFHGLGEPKTVHKLSSRAVLRLGRQGRFSNNSYISRQHIDQLTFCPPHPSPPPLPRGTCNNNGKSDTWDITPNRTISSEDTTLLIEAVMALQSETVALLLGIGRANTREEDSAAAEGSVFVAAVVVGGANAADPNPYASLEFVLEKRRERMFNATEVTTTAVVQSAPRALAAGAPPRARAAFVTTAAPMPRMPAKGPAPPTAGKKAPVRLPTLPLVAALAQTPAFVSKTTCSIGRLVWQDVPNPASDYTSTIGMAPPPASPSSIISSAGMPMVCTNPRSGHQIQSLVRLVQILAEFILTAPLACNVSTDSGIKERQQREKPEFHRIVRSLATKEDERSGDCRAGEKKKSNGESCDEISSRKSCSTNSDARSLRSALFMLDRFWARPSVHERVQALAWRQCWAPVSSAQGAWEEAAIHFAVQRLLGEAENNNNNNNNNNNSDQNDVVHCAFVDPTTTTSTSSASAAKLDCFPFPVVIRYVHGAAAATDFGISIPGMHLHASLFMRLICEKSVDIIVDHMSRLLLSVAAATAAIDRELARVYEIVRLLFAAGARDYSVVWKKSVGNTAGRIASPPLMTNAFSCCIEDLYWDEQRLRRAAAGSAEDRQRLGAAADCLHRHRLASLKLLVKLAASAIPSICVPETNPLDTAAVAVAHADLYSYVNSNTFGVNGSTALHIAVMHEEIDVAEFLLFGANVDCGLGDVRCQTALYLHVSRMGGSNSNSNNSGSISSDTNINNLELLKLLLRADLVRQQQQLLREASNNHCQRNVVAATSSLVDTPADNGMTPLEAAVSSCAPVQVIDLLLLQHADQSSASSGESSASTRTSGSNGAKLLMLAVEAVSAWARPGCTVFHNPAIPQRFFKIVELLLRRGCDPTAVFDRHHHVAALGVSSRDDASVEKKRAEQQQQRGGTAAEYAQVAEKLLRVMWERELTSHSLFDDAGGWTLCRRVQIHAHVACMLKMIVPRTELEEYVMTATRIWERRVRE